MYLTTVSKLTDEELIIEARLMNAGPFSMLISELADRLDASNGDLDELRTTHRSENALMAAEMLLVNTSN